jgi:spore germination protein
MEGAKEAHPMNRRALWPLWPRKQRILRLGDQGEPVAKLQERLQSLGYGVGAVDGVYGFLTEDSVCILQREFGLKVDGIAGPQVMELLQDPSLRVGNGACEIWGATWEDSSGEVRWKPPETMVEALDGLLIYCFSLAENGDIAGDVSQATYSMATSQQLQLVPVISNLHEDIYDELALENLLRHNQVRHRFLDTVSRLVSDAGIHGIAVDLQKVGMGYGRRFVALMQEVRKIIDHSHKKMYMVLVPANGRGGNMLPRMIDNRIWRTLPDRVILYAPREHVTQTPGPKLGVQWLQTQFQRTRRHLPAWKLMVMLPIDSIVWRIEGNLREYRYLSYDDARKLAWQKQAKISRDAEEGVSYYDFLDEEGRSRVWFENRDSIRPKLTWLKRQHVAGLVFIPIGGEDPRIWQL